MSKSPSISTTPGAQMAIPMRELTEVLIRHFGLHEGRYHIAFGLRIGVGQIPRSPSDPSTMPGAVVGIDGVNLEVAPPNAEGPDIVDASTVNPAPKAKAKPRKVAAKV